MSSQTSMRVSSGSTRLFSSNTSTTIPASRRPSANARRTSLNASPTRTTSLPLTSSSASPKCARAKRTIAGSSSQPTMRRAFPRTLPWLG